MDAASQGPMEVVLLKHTLDVWVTVFSILAIIIMTSSLLCPGTAVIIYLMQTHWVLSGAVYQPPKRAR
uniref:small integral membrane protein 3-like n=1 Tax=Callithrix jacchus TaxID=9483 RepID=UPI000265596F|nr:small integral membrane protein 3-like [Callithrix jacchus]